jgi:hypothetical protein
VPGGLRQYGITFSHRGTVDYTQAELVAGRVTLALS